MNPLPTPPPCPCILGLAISSAAEAAKHLLGDEEFGILRELSEVTRGSSTSVGLIMVLVELVDDVGSFDILPEHSKGVDGRFGAVLGSPSVVAGF